MIFDKHRDHAPLKLHLENSRQNTHKKTKMKWYILTDVYYFIDFLLFIIKGY